MAAKPTYRPTWRAPTAAETASELHEEHPGATIGHDLPPLNLPGLDGRNAQAGSDVVTGNAATPV